MEKLANYIVRKMLQYEIIDEERQDDYIYALIQITESAIVVGSIFLISVILGRVIPTTIFLLFFYLLRRRIGGYHAKTFKGCYIMSIVFYLIGWCWGENVYINLKEQFLIFLIASLIIFSIGAEIHPNMKMTQQEIIATKKKARLVLTLETIIVLFVKHLGTFLLIVSYMMYAIVLCCICILLAVFHREEKLW